MHSLQPHATALRRAAVPALLVRHAHCHQHHPHTTQLGGDAAAGLRALSAHAIFAGQSHALRGNAGTASALRTLPLAPHEAKLTVVVLYAIKVQCVRSKAVLMSDEHVQEQVQGKDVGQTLWCFHCLNAMYCQAEHMLCLHSCTDCSQTDNVIRTKPNCLLLVGALLVDSLAL